MFERGWSARFVFSFSCCLCALWNRLFVCDDVDSYISRFEPICSIGWVGTVLIRYFYVFDFDFGFGFAYNRSYGRCRY